MDNEVLRHDVGEGGGVTKRCAPLYRKTNAQQMQDFQAALSAGGLIEQISIDWKTRKYKTVGFTNNYKLEFSQGGEEEEVLY
jgi:hypothetical protein